MLFFPCSLTKVKMTYELLKKNTALITFLAEVKKLSLHHTKSVALPRIERGHTCRQTFLNKFICYPVEADCQLLAMHCHFCLKQIGLAQEAGGLVPK